MMQDQFLNTISFKKKYSISTIFSLFCLFMYTFSQVFYYSNVKISLPIFYSITETLRIASLLFFGILSLYKIRTIKNLFRFAIILLLSIVIFILTKNHEFYFILLVVLVYGMQKVSLKDSIFVINIGIIASFSIIVLMSMLNVIDNNVFIRITENSRTIRNSFGFQHPNGFGFMLLVISINTMIFSNLKKNKYLSMSSIITSICSVFLINTLADSKTSAGLIFIMLAITFFIDRNWFNSKQLFHLSNWLVVFSVGFTYFFSINYQYGNSIHELLNKALSNRVMLLHQFYRVYEFSFLGQNVEMTTYRFGNDYFFLDNGFGRMFIEFGVLYLICFLLLIFYSNYIAYKNDDINVSVYIIFIAIYTLIQDRMVVDAGWILPAVYVLTNYSSIFLKLDENPKNKLIRNEEVFQNYE
ncbi:hypothetical protein [Enterococcus olivae]